MSEFNPQIADLNLPNYFKYSEPIKDVKADQSTGLLLSTVGEGIEGAAKLATTTAHDIISKDVRNTVEPIRSQFTADLQAARDSLIPNAVQTSSGSTVRALGYADENQPDVPDVIRTGLANVQSLQGAMVNGKINDTYYHQRLDTAVTALRSKYPGFVDYIDENVSKITGVNPANATIADMMQDINRATTNRKTEEDKILDIARSKGMNYDQGEKMYERLKADPSFAPQFLKWFNDEQVKDTQMGRDKNDLELKKMKGADSEKDWQGNFSSWVSNKLDSNLNATITLSGTDKPETILGVIQKAASDPNYYSSAQMEEFATKLQAHKDIFRSQLVAMSNSEGYTKKVGGVAARDAEIDSQLKFYDSLYNAVRGGGSGGAGFAFFQQNLARAIMDKTRVNLTSGKMGDAINNFEILSQKVGPALTASVLIPAFLKGQANMPDNLKGLFGEKVVEAHAQPGGDANPTTLAGHMAKINADDRIDAASKAFVYKGLVDTVDSIKNPKAPDEDKAGIVRYLFDPSNNGNLQNWKMDYRTTSPDGRLQVIHPGKYAIWTQLTDKDVSNNIAKLDEKTKAFYHSWVDITGRELIGQDVRNLNHFTGHDNLYFSWKNVNGTPRLELEDKEGAASPVGNKAAPYAEGFQRPITTGYKAQVQQVVDRINSALPNLEHVYKTFGGTNTEAMLLNTLQQYGMDFNGKISGLPKAFGDAIAASRKKPETK